MTIFAQFVCVKLLQISKFNVGDYFISIIQIKILYGCLLSSKVSIVFKKTNNFKFVVSSIDYLLLNERMQDCNRNKLELHLNRDIYAVDKTMHDFRL